MAEPSNPGAPRLLFIEDHEATRDALARLLCSEGFIVEPASNGAAGMALARDHRHDAILLDLRLPDIPGLQVLSELRCHGVFVPCVILTGFPGIQSSLEAGRLGAVSYLEKPALAADLVAALRAAVRRSSTRTQLFAPRPVVGPPITNVIGESIDRLAASNIRARAGVAQQDHWQDLARPLARAADHPSVTFCQFVEISTGLRTLLQCDGQQRLLDVVASIRRSFEQAAKRDTVATSQDTDRILHRLETSGRALRTVRQDELAGALSLSHRYVERALEDDFGLTFSACRLTVLMRKAVCELVGGREHVRQVAFHAGYEDHGNFDRSFRSYFGVTPTPFRKLREGR